MAIFTLPLPTRTLPAIDSRAVAILSGGAPTVSTQRLVIPFVGALVAAGVLATRTP